MTWHDSLGAVRVRAQHRVVRRPSRPLVESVVVHRPEPRAEAPAAEPMDESAADGGAADEGHRHHGAEGGMRRPGGGALSHLAAGTAFGTLVHAVLEGIDFAAVDLEGRSARRLAPSSPAARSRFSTTRAVTAPPVVEASRPSSRQRWRPFHGRCLAQIARVDRVDEMASTCPSEVLRPRRSARWERRYGPPARRRPDGGVASRLGAAGSQSSLRVTSPVRSTSLSECATPTVQRARGDRLQDEPAHPLGAAASERDYDRSSMASP